MARLCAIRRNQTNGWSLLPFLCWSLSLWKMLVLSPVVESFSDALLLGRQRSGGGSSGAFSSSALSSSEDCTTGTMNVVDEGAINSHTNSRRAAIGRLVGSTAVAACAGIGLSPSLAAAASSDTDSVTKQTNLSEEELLAIVVEKDLVANQFLVSGRLTRSIYDEACVFTDEIDTYTLDKWITGTSRLFDANRSRVTLVPGSATISKSDGSLSFRFYEYLCFNIPFVKPITYLSGKLVLERSPSTGLITSYKEIWDQDVNTVVSQNSKLFTSGLSNDSLDADLETFGAKMESLFD